MWLYPEQQRKAARQALDPIQPERENAYQVMGLTVTPLDASVQQPRAPATTHFRAPATTHYRIDTPRDQGDEEASPRSNISYPWWPVARDAAGADSGTYHASTRLKGGRLGLLVDPGAHSNLVGSEWADDMREACRRAGHPANSQALAQTFRVQGVGKDADPCVSQTEFPIATQDISQAGAGVAGLDTFTAPEIPNSGVPALLGLETLRRNHALLDCGKAVLHLCGPGPLQIQLPPGSRSFDLEIAPSGHMLLPCDNFTEYNRPRKVQGADLVRPAPPPITLLIEPPSSGASSSTSRLAGS